MSDNGVHHTKRDAETLTFLGAFLMILGVPVMIGTFWAGEDSFYHLVNFTAGLIIFAIGAGFLWRGRLYAKEQK